MMKCGSRPVQQNRFPRQYVSRFRPIAEALQLLLLLYIQRLRISISTKTIDTGSDPAIDKTNRGAAQHGAG